jgi:hypothetical protein
MLCPFSSRDSAYVNVGIKRPLGGYEMDHTAKTRKTDSNIKMALLMLALALTIACNGIGSQSTNNAPNGKLVFPGCYAPSATTSNADCGLANSLGDANADTVFQTEIATQRQFWQGTPANVHPWNDCSGPNAVSLPSGDILYGVNLFQQLVTAYGGDAAPISGVLAHEWGHQIQFDNGWFTSSEPTSRPIELEADAFSGYYMALAESYSWTSIDNYLSAVASKGDYNYTEPTHHGTPQERLAAAQLGFQTALQATQTQTQLTYSDLHQIFSTTIAGFSERQAPAPQSDGSVVSDFLASLDNSQILEILNGISHGKDMSVPHIENREQLYPRK